MAGPILTLGLGLYSNVHRYIVLGLSLGAEQGPVMWLGISKVGGITYHKTTVRPSITSSGAMLSSISGDLNPSGLTGTSATINGDLP